MHASPGKMREAMVTMHHELRLLSPIHMVLGGTILRIESMWNRKASTSPPRSLFFEESNFEMFALQKSLNLTSPSMNWLLSSSYVSAPNANYAKMGCMQASGCPGQSATGMRPRGRVE